MKIQPITICWQPMKKQNKQQPLFKGFSKPMKVREMDKRVNKCF